jgi:hypothetical protein
MFAPCSGNKTLIGTASQIEWAERIRANVAQEFDRVANAFRAVAARQTERGRAETQIVLEILDEKRVRTMGNDRAGYFIRNWQELNDQVRKLIFEDSRYQTIKAGRAARKEPDERVEQIEQR